MTKWMLTQQYLWTNFWKHFNLLKVTKIIWCSSNFDFFFDRWPNFLPPRQPPKKTHTKKNNQPNKYHTNKKKHVSFHYTGAEGQRFQGVFPTFAKKADRLTFKKDGIKDEILEAVSTGPALLCESQQ